jgi:hypothetical protein
MITDWIYNNPTWLWGSIMVVGLCVLACIGLAIFHRLVHVEVRRAHNDLAGFTVAIISVVYAVLLAFIAIATWESYTAADEIVQSEADYVGSIYRDTEGLPPEVGQSIRNDLEVYIRTVIDQEWPVQREGKMPDQGWDALRPVAYSNRTDTAAKFRSVRYPSRVAQNAERSVSRARKPAVGRRGTYTRRDLVDHFPGRRDRDQLYLFVRLCRSAHAHGNDRGGRGLARPGGSVDHRAGLALPRRGEYRA